MSPNSFQEVPQVSLVTPEPGKHVETLQKIALGEHFPLAEVRIRSLPLIELRTMIVARPQSYNYSAQPVRG